MRGSILLELIGGPHCGLTWEHKLSGHPPLMVDMLRSERPIKPGERLAGVVWPQGGVERTVDEYVPHERKADRLIYLWKTWYIRRSKLGEAASHGSGCG